MIAKRTASFFVLTLLAGALGRAPSAEAVSPLLGADRWGTTHGFDLDANIALPGEEASQFGLDSFFLFEFRGRLLGGGTLRATGTAGAGSANRRATGYGYGVYFNLPMALSSGEHEPGEMPGDSIAPLFPTSEYREDPSLGTTAFGNIDFGLFATVGLNSIILTFHGGVGIPSAEGGWRDRIALAGAFRGGRLTDIALALPDTAPVRLGASINVALASLELQGDVGTDILADVGPRQDRTRTLLRANAGAVLHMGIFKVFGEWANVVSLSGPMPILLDKTVESAISGGVALGVQQLDLLLGITIPLSDTPRALSKMGLTLGMRMDMP